MGAFEQAFFAKHFRSIDRLKAFRKRFNQCNFTEDYTNAVWVQFDGPHKTHYTHTNPMGGPLIDEKNRRVVWVKLTKHKIDKEIERREKLCQH